MGEISDSVALTQAEKSVFISMLSDWSMEMERARKSVVLLSHGISEKLGRLINYFLLSFQKAHEDTNLCAFSKIKKTNKQTNTQSEQKRVLSRGQHNIFSL